MFAAVSVTVDNKMLFVIWRVVGVTMGICGVGVKAVQRAVLAMLKTD